MGQPDTEPSVVDGEPDPAGTAAYIASMTMELAELARRSRLEIVAYLLDIARLEAADAVHGGRTSLPRPDSRFEKD